MRHHSRFMPRDIDVPPYFEVVEPTLAGGFDHRSLRWHDALWAVVERSDQPDMHRHLGITPRRFRESKQSL